MAETVTVAARVTPEIDAGLERLSKATGRSKSALMGEALQSFVKSELEFIEAVEAGRADARAGRTVDHATVVAMMDRLLGRS